MTALSAPLRLNTEVAARPAGPAARAPRWVRHLRDGKLQRMAGLESFQGCNQSDLVALGAAADLMFATAGAVLAQGADLRRFWWMPVEGWLLVDAEGNQAITVPAGRSWTAGAGTPAQLRSLRPGAVLVAPIAGLHACIEGRPRLAEAIHGSLVSGRV